MPILGERFYQMSNAIFCYDLKPIPLAVYSYLVCCAGQKDLCWPSIKTIALHCSCSENAARDAVKQYLTGRSVQKDAAKAAEYLRHAADQNHPWVNYLLGKLHLTGSGVPKDEEAAWNCFRMADACGHPSAQYILERQDQWHQPQLLMTVSRLLYHMSNIFWDNAPTAPAQPRLHIDRKRIQELQELRIALGHQPDDHEEEQTQTQTWGGMTMKGW